MIQDNEVVYDAEIAPLMDQVIAICKAHNIPVIASFQLTDETEDETPLMCTTVILSKDACPMLHRMNAAIGHVEAEGRGGIPRT